MASILNAAFFAWAMSTFMDDGLVTSAPRALATFEFDRKRHEQPKRRTTGKAAFSDRPAGLAKL